MTTPDRPQAGDTTLLATLRAVHKRYGNTVALDGLDLEVRRGELVALLGPNGAGKSTAIALMLGLTRADSGVATLFGESPERVEVRRRIGVMMQDVVLHPDLRVSELLDLITSYYPSPYTPAQVMELTHIASLAQRPYGKLSGGQKRQVQFAMAVCGRPQLLFLDEPTVGLDVQARELMWTTIRRLVRQGCSIVLTTHYLEEAEALADRVAVINKGRMIAAGTVSEMRSIVSRKRITCVTSVPVERVGAWPEVESATHDSGRMHVTTANAEAVVRRLLASDDALAELEVRRAGLSEAFTELTQEAA
jgi:ABC-2 type transport system ATP-binding protein